MSNPKQGNAQTTETPEQELARLKAEIAALKKKNAPKTSLKVSQKGAVSMYGLGRFPVTLYREQWQRLLDKKSEVLDFIEENTDKLAVKEA